MDELTREPDDMEDDEVCCVLRWHGLCPVHGMDERVHKHMVEELKQLRSAKEGREGAMVEGARLALQDNCPDCGGSGYIVRGHAYTNDAEQEQCERCAHGFDAKAQRIIRASLDEKGGVE